MANKTMRDRWLARCKKGELIQRTIIDRYQLDHDYKFTMTYSPWYRPESIVDESSGDDDHAKLVARSGAFSHLVG